VSFSQLTGWRTARLDDVKVWLAETDDVDQVALASKLLTKIRPSTNQHRPTPLGVLDIDESMRRTERRLGELVRAGQAAGTINRTRSGPGRSPHEITDRSRLHWAYILFDGVSDEQFDAAINEGRRQGSLRRLLLEELLHPVRVAHRRETRKGHDRTWMPLTERLDQIRRLANTGHRSNQIAQMLGITGDHVRRLAKTHDIRLPEGRTGNRPVDPNRVLAESTSTLEGVAMAIGLIDTDELDPGRVPEWAASLKDSIRTLQHLHKEMTR
jgi:hypothetical protein